MFDINRLGKELNDKYNFNRGITEEPHIFKFGLNPVPNIWELFPRHQCELMTAPLSKDSPMIVREFDVSYAAIIKKQTLFKTKEFDELPLLNTLV